MFSFKKLLNDKKLPLVMGILNITPDSFSDGGEAFTVEDAVRKTKQLCDEGADIIDVGACSTAPCNDIVSEEVELERLEKFLPAIIRCADVPVSVDTFRPSVAEYALSQGALIINDESGIYNKCMAECVARYKAGWIFMHTGGADSVKSSKYPDGVVEDVVSFFDTMKKHALDMGLKEEQLCFDFGIGFGKTRHDDLELLSSCDKLSKFSPLLVGVSRKRIVGEITGEPDPKNRVAGSVAAVTVCVYNGAEIVRVHDVKETVDALKICCAIKRGEM